MEKTLTASLLLHILYCSNLNGQFLNEWTRYPYVQNGYSGYNNQVDECKIYDRKL